MGRVHAYHPADLFAEKRKKKALEREKAKSGLSKIDMSNAEEAPPEKELTGDALVLNRAEKYLEAATVALDQLYSKYNELMALNQNSLAVEADDNDRKGFHKSFLEGVKALEEMSLNCTVQGDKLFSGQFAKEGKIIQLEEIGTGPMSLRVEPITISHLKLDRIKIDTLINARKAVVDLEKGKDVFEKLQKLLKSKLDTVYFKVRKLASGEEGQNSPSAKSASVSTMSKLKQEVLKTLRSTQEQLAEERGEDKALLINSKA